MAAQGVSVESDRLPIGRRPVRAFCAGQAEAGLFVEGSGGPEAAAASCPRGHVRSGAFQR